jgi:iron(III) transport system substrate-binding protein
MQGISRRQLIAAVAAGSALSHGAAAQDIPAHERELYDAAKKEGELTWYSGQLNSETGEAVGHAFTQRYPGVKVNVVRSTSQVAYQRLSQDMQA